MSETPVLTAFLDANVLYPALLRDILLRLAARGLFRARWSAKVHEEWTGALHRNRPDVPAAKTDRIRELMDANFQEALVEGYEHRITSLALPDADDRHVFAAAIHCGANILVTTNLRDFPDDVLAGQGIQVFHPDAFILALLSADKETVVDTISRMRRSFKKPPRSVEELLATMMDHGLVASAAALRECVDKFYG